MLYGATVVTLWTCYGTLQIVVLLLLLFDSKIFESANPFRIESNRIGTADSNRISKLRRSLQTIVVRYHSTTVVSYG